MKIVLTDAVSAKTMVMTPDEFAAFLVDMDDKAGYSLEVIGPNLQSHPVNLFGVGFVHPDDPNSPVPLSQVCRVFDYNLLLPEGDSDRVMDRYTAVIERPDGEGSVILTMSANPFSPQGVSLLETVDWTLSDGGYGPDFGGPNYGPEIHFDELPEAVKAVVLAEVRDEWGDAVGE